MRSTNVAYLPAVDHIRAYASLLIVLYHSVHLISAPLVGGRPAVFGVWPQAQGPLSAVVIEGHTAVAMFMVLSGFIFTRAALGHRIAYPGFVRNRLLRIYPLFVALLLLGIALRPERFAVLPFLQTLLAFGNHPGAIDLGPMSAMFWTIGVEFQFYLVFPLLLGLVHRFGSGSLVAIVLAALALRALAVALGGDVHQITYWTLLGRIDQFLIGMLAAVYFASPRFPRRAWRWLLVPSLAALGLALAAFHAAGGWPVAASWKLAWPTLEAALWGCFLLAYVALADAIPPLLSRVIARVGEISYSTYLLHYFLIYALVERQWLLRVGADPLGTALLNGCVVVLPLVLAAASLSYRGIERPFLRLRGGYLRPLPTPRVHRAV